MGNRYMLLVEGEPYLSACKAWKESYETSREAAHDFIKSLGAHGGYSNLGNLGLSGVNLVHPLPLGWKRIPGRRGQPDYMVPHDRARDPEQKLAGQAARKTMDALPKPNDQKEIADLIGAPHAVHWEAGELQEGWRSVSVSFFNTIQVTYFGDTFVLIAPDTRQTIAELLEEHPGAVIKSGDWTPPPGLKEISEAQHDLLRAQWKVAMEQQGEDVSDE